MFSYRKIDFFVTKLGLRARTGAAKKVGLYEHQWSLFASIDGVGNWPLQTGDGA